jgi:hypothetical protein
VRHQAQQVLLQVALQVVVEVSTENQFARDARIKKETIVIGQGTEFAE